MIRRPSRKRFLLYLSILLAFLLAGGYYWWRQSHPNEQYLIQRTLRYPERGDITDRHGKLLAGNQTISDLMVIPAKTGRMDTAKFCRILGISRRQFLRRLDKARAVSATRPSSFLSVMPEPVMAALRPELSAFPGFIERKRTFRRYPDSLAAHLLGFANMISEQAVKNARGYSRPGDPAGRLGLELVYDSLLRGKRGVYFTLVDSLGRTRGRLEDGQRDTVMVPGKTLRTSIDLDLQRLATQLMHDKMGSIVAIDPTNGEVLAYLSSPGYSPNLLTGPDTRTHLVPLRNDSYHPLMNRPIRGRNSPGSSLKPIMALIALQQGIITPNDAFFCPQFYMAGDHRVNCEHFDGTVRLRKGIAQSCNTYFCHLFDKQMKHDPAETAASYENWRTQLAAFGIGSTLGIDLPKELSGQLPPGSFYDKMYGRDHWTANDIISLAIGQGEMEVTPLQLANMQCIIANRGYYFTPHLVQAVGGKPLLPSVWTEKHTVPIDAEHFEPVIDGMQDAVEKGTAVGIRIPGIALVGKTGTVQNSRGKSHSIFAGFAPRDRPKIAIAVIVENAGYGASFAAPIASYLVEQYLTGKVTKPAEQVKWMMDQNLMPDPSDSLTRPLPLVKPATNHATGH